MTHLNSPTARMRAAHDRLKAVIDRNIGFPECIEASNAFSLTAFEEVPHLLGMHKPAATARRLYLDLDGVMADFDAHFPARFGLPHGTMPDDTLWGHINSDPTYFLDMPTMPGAIEFFRSIEHLDPIILTACPHSSYAHVAGQKRQWVRNHLSKTATVLPVMGGRNKVLFMHAEGDVLIDDYEKNCTPWSQAGGISILHRNFDDTTNSLKYVFKMEVS